MFSFFDVCRFLKYVHGSLDLIPKTPHKVYGIKFFVVKLDHNAPMHNDKVVQLSQQNVRYSKHIGWTQLNDQLTSRFNNGIIRSQEVHYRELIYIIVGNINFFKSMICTYTVHYFLPEREYKEMIQNRRSKHKDINDMLDNTIQTI